MPDSVIMINRLSQLKIIEFTVVPVPKYICKYLPVPVPKYLGKYLPVPVPR